MCRCGFMEAFLWKSLEWNTHIYNVDRMRFSEAEQTVSRRGHADVRSPVAVREEGFHRQHLQQHPKVLLRLRVVILLNNWISTEPRSMTLSTADHFCWIWSYSKWSQIILPNCQENLKAFKPLCPKRYFKSAKAAHTTRGPQNALELLGSIKLSIFYWILMHLSCTPSIKRTLTWSRKDWGLLLCLTWISARRRIKDLF